MQNKPNVKDAQINVNSYMKNKYEKMDTWLSGKNKPNQSQTNPKQTQSPKRPKMNIKFYKIMAYENNPLHRRNHNKPKQTQFKPNFCQEIPKMLIIWPGGSIIV
jgi:hypothetical protein